jgi:hypothetical protein
MRQKKNCPCFREEPGVNPGLSRNCEFERTSQIFPAVRSRVNGLCTIRYGEGIPGVTGGPFEFENRNSSDTFFLDRKGAKRKKQSSQQMGCSTGILSASAPSTRNGRPFF